MATQPVIQIRDAQGNVVTGDSATSVTVSIASGTGGTLGGTATVTASSGIATFTNLTLAGSVTENYVLRFESTPALTGIDSSSIAVISDPSCAVTGISTGSAPIGDTGGTGSFTVSTNGPSCVWAASVDSLITWVTITQGASGQGESGTIGYSIDVNPTTLERTATISVGGFTHVITQDGEPCVVTGVDPATASIDAAGGSGSFTVSTNGSNCEWTATVTAGDAWVSISSGDSGQGESGTVSYSVSANADAVERTATISVGGFDHTITQAAASCAVTGISTASSEAEASGDTGSFAVSTNGPSCTWAVVADPAATWLTITSGESGTGDSGTIEYSVAENTTAFSRTATLTIAGYEHVVTQAAAPDCDTDGTSDIEAIAAGAADCNANGIPDTCDIADGTETDYDSNCVPDSCESSVVISVPKDFATIQAAIDAASDGWIVEVAEGTYREAIDLGTKAITVEATGAAAATIIDGELVEGDATSRVATVLTIGLAPGDGFAILRGFTITGGSGGTAVPAQADLFGGGGIYLDDSDARIESCIVTGNSAGCGGGVFLHRGSAVIADCVIIANTADADGGGIHFLDSTGIVSGSLISANVATLRGGGIHAVGGAPSVSSSTLSGNSAGDVGGGVGWYAESSPMTLTTVLLEANVAATQGDAGWVREGY